MKKIALLLLVILPLWTFSQNQNFETSTQIQQSQKITTEKQAGNNTDQYYRTVLPADGTLKIYVSGTNTGSGSGYLYMYGYDRRKASGLVFSEYIFSSSVKAGDQISDTITVYGRVADTFYFRLISTQAFSYTFSYELKDISPNDAEPNDNFTTAIPIGNKEKKQGHIGYLYNGTSDKDDYYMAVLPDDGTLNIYVDGSNNGPGSGYLYMYGYDRRKASGLVFSEYISSSSVKRGDSVSDTITISGRAADTFYFRLISTQAFSYRFNYEMTDISTNDVEPNDDFATALTIGNEEQKQGHIGYKKNGTADNNDYYKTRLPFDGAIKIIVEGVQKDAGTGYLYLYGYDVRKGSGQVFGTYIGGKSSVRPGEKIVDTILVTGRQADSFYFKFMATSAFQYKIRYEMVENENTDTEPNDSFEQAVYMKNGISQSGQIGYKSGSFTDANDYYMTVLPADGTLKIYVKGTNNGSGGGYLYMYGYDRRKASGLVFSEYISSSSVKAGDVISDTITVFGRGADTFYFRLISTQAFSYDFSYEMTDVSKNDEEPNDDFLNALFIESKEPKQGHIGYLYNGTSDQNDYYSAVLPSDGTLKIYIKGANNGSGSGYMSMYGYDRRKAGGLVFSEYISSSSTKSGDLISDTITVFGRAADTFYFRLISTQAFSYDFSYEMVDISPNDIELNDDFATALSIDNKEQKQGHIGYLYNGTSDQNDYYRAVLPSDGTLKIYIKGANNGSGSGYMSMYGYDRRKAGGLVFSEYISSSSIKPGDRISDTITVFGRAADTFYFRLISTQAFSYDFSYEMVDVTPNDAEPNDDFATAISMENKEQKQGHIGYLYNGTSDQNDYYMTVLPDDGTLKIYVKGTNNGSGGGYLYMYGYDRRKASGLVFSEYILSSSVKAGNPVSDTITVHGRAADTFYFRFISTQAFSYSFSYEMADTSINDPEPNNSFEEAIPFQEQEVKKGHIGYALNGATDKDDYYVTVLPSQGTMKIFVNGQNAAGGNGYLYMSVYDARKSAILLGKYIQGSSIPAGTVVNDTLIISCRAIDSIYLRIYSSAAFKYQFSFEMEGNAVSDEEENDLFNSAKDRQIKDTIKGTIGYYKKGIRDNNDYYKMPLPDKGNLILFVEGKNTGNSNGRLEVLVYNKNKSLLGRRVIETNTAEAGRSVMDTFTVSCITSDSVYLLINSTSCFSYSIRMKSENYQPVADLTYERLGNTFGFRPQYSNADDFSWTFGRENAADTLSNTPYPMITFKPGNQSAKLIVRNNVCNFKDTAAVSFVIKGVEYYTPEKAGIGGDLNVSVFGGGLDSKTKISLVQGSTTLNPVDLNTNSLQDHLTAIFDVHQVESGFYDVVINIPGEETIVYANGLQLEGLIYPETTSEVLGPDRWRINADTKFRLAVSNKGNVMASGAVVALIWPKGVDITFEDKFYSPSETGVETVVVDDTAYSVARADYKFVYEELNTTIAIDTFNLQPYDGYIRYILLPHVPAGGVAELPFIARSTSNGKSNFITYTFKTNQRGSCDNPVYANYEDNVTAAILDGSEAFADKVKFPPLKILAKVARIGSKHAGSASSYIGKKFWSMYDGYEFDGDGAYTDYMKETIVNNEYATQALANELGSLVLEDAGKRLEKYSEKVDFINKRLASNPNMSAELTGKYLDVLNSLPHDANRRIEVMKAMLKNVKDAGDASGKYLELQKLLENCPELKKQMEDIVKDMEQELNIRDPKDKETDRVTSLDPNEISGPAGVGINRYLNTGDHQHFTIFYENVDTAQAAAQIVIVRDTLDKTKYDLNTFEFGNMSIGTKTIRLPKGRKEFVIERNIQQNIPVKVRINGALDTATGVIEWQFTSLDTITGRLPVLEGFLPPNQNKPEGEGFVSFTVKPFNGLADGTVFENKATIIFDQNEAIMTNTWRNVLDLGKPASSLNAIVTADTLIKLNFNGTDAVSGVGYYNLYIKKNNGSWIAFGGTSTETLYLTGEKDSTYSFYVVSRDKVGNLEDKNAFAEATVTISRALNVQFGNLSGKNEETSNRLTWNTFGEDEGDYFVMERSGDGKEFKPLATILAKGHATDYTYIDSEPGQGSNYYRIKIVNIEGYFSYSNVVLLKMQNNSKLKVYPNPVEDILLVQLKGGSNGNNRLSLINMFGQKVFDRTVSGDKIQIDMQKMAAGMYYLIYRSNGQEEKIKIIKK